MMFTLLCETGLSGPFYSAEIALFKKNHFGLALVIHPPNTHLCEFTSGSIFKQTKKPKKQHSSVALSRCYGLLCTPMAVGLLDVNTP